MVDERRRCFNKAVKIVYDMEMLRTGVSLDGWTDDNKKRLKELKDWIFEAGVEGCLTLDVSRALAELSEDMTDSDITALIDDLATVHTKK